MFQFAHILAAWLPSPALWAEENFGHTLERHIHHITNLPDRFNVFQSISLSFRDSLWNEPAGPCKIHHNRARKQADCPTSWHGLRPAFLPVFENRTRHQTALRLQWPSMRTAVETAPHKQSPLRKTAISIFQNRRPRLQDPEENRGSHNDKQIDPGQLQIAHRQKDHQAARDDEPDEKFRGFPQGQFLTDASTQCAAIRQYLRETSKFSQEIPRVQEINTPGMILTISGTVLKEIFSSS